MIMIYIVSIAIAKKTVPSIHRRAQTTGRIGTPFDELAAFVFVKPGVPVGPVAVLRRR